MSMSYYPPPYHSQPSQTSHYPYNTHHHYHYEYHHQPSPYASPYQHHQPYSSYGQSSYPSYGHSSYPSYGQSSYPSYGHSSYPSYGHQSYGHHSQPSQGHSGNSLVSAASLLIPLLGLIGLSLLVPSILGGGGLAGPSFVRIPAKRDVNHVDKHAQALADIYSAVLSSDSCIQKLYCEMGNLAKHAQNKQALFKLIERMVPVQYSTELAILKASSESSDYMCTKFYCKVTAVKNFDTGSSDATKQQKDVQTATYKQNSRIK